MGPIWCYIDFKLFSIFVLKLEENDRKWIQDVKDTERNSAMEDLEKWKDEQRIIALKVLF